MKLKIKYKLMMLATALIGLTASCSDEPDGDNYYTFKGQMMSQYLKDSAQYSDFATIVERAGLMDLLSTYGSYTCFVPTNEAVERYLKERKMTSLADLSDKDCDTIARTHLLSQMYTTSEFSLGAIPSPNMLKRYLQVSFDKDENQNAVVVVNKRARVLFASQNDSVENGIMQPVNEVLTSSSDMLPDVIRQNKKATLFYEALEKTGIAKLMYKYKDESWNGKNYEQDHEYSSDGHKEVASPPEDKLYGFAAFVETDSVFNLRGIHSLQQMYDYACEVYDKVYPQDKDIEAHKFENITDPKNPLYRFMAYHVINRNPQGINYLTPLDDIGIETTRMNPEDWYETLLPHTMINIQKVTVRTNRTEEEKSTARLNFLTINRRFDKAYQIPGVTLTEVTDFENVALNGIYFYIGDVIAFSEEVQNIVHNRRIRMDMATVFPELMTMGIRLNGNPWKDEDETKREHKYGDNYYFPNGYLDNVTINGGYFIYRRPHNTYWSYEGDEFNNLGEDYDITFRIPPVPYSGTYQIRIGYAALARRGIGQIYFDGKPQGIPLDMRILINDPKISVSSTWQTYANMTADDRDQSRKALKNKGFYRGAYGGYHYTGNRIDKEPFFDCPNTFRLVVTTTDIDATQDHYLRFRNVSKGENPEFMIDYIELVPKSVYGVGEGDEAEDDL